jgi:hypothetical protein
MLIGKIERKNRIYRVFPRDRFFSLFEDGNNALVLPAKWQDPFENVILKSKVRMENGEFGCFKFHNDLFGQCWTLESASDAIWQIYSRDQNAVRVRTTIGALIDSLSAHHPERANTTCFIGRVNYFTDKKLREFGRDIFRSGITPESVARSLLVKRRAYKHENEVRLIYFEPGKVRHNDGVYKYKLNPLAVFDQAMIDGRVSYPDFVPFKKEVIRRSGLPGDRVKRSLLYTPPKDFFVEIP